MTDQLFYILDHVDDFLWGYIAPAFLIFFGIWLCIKSRFFQIRRFPHIIRYFLGLMHVGAEGGCETTRGVHPLHAFFASVGGCVGIGNVVLACTAVKIGGPGALFWIWVTALVGAMIKYAEVFLGVRHRVSRGKEGYAGGPIFFLQRVIKSRWMPIVVGLLFCVYGVEILQFNIVVESMSTNFGLPKPALIMGLTALVVYAGVGGVGRVGRICTAIIPVFTAVYVVMGLWVLVKHVHEIPAALSCVVSCAFTGHAAIGGFAGSTFIMAFTQGMRRACYSGDIGIGYASVLHSESCSASPARQASLTIVEIFLDTFITVTTTVLVVIITGIWHEPIHESLMVQTVLAEHFPGTHLFMPAFLFLLGYSTLIAYFVFGMRAGEYLSPKWGKKIYITYAVVAFGVFSYLPTHVALSIQSVAGALLLIINVYGMYRMRDEVSFDS